MIKKAMQAEPLSFFISVFLERRVSGGGRDFHIECLDYINVKQLSDTGA